MTIYLGLGANDGDRKHNLERAVAALVAAGFRLRRVSPVVESPALLPADAEPDWHKPYLNLVVSGDADWQPREGLAIAKKIERELGRGGGRRWSPRPIDIDILYWHDHNAGDGNSDGEDDGNSDGALTIPHADARRRDFVLTPLLHLQPDLPVGEHGETVFQLTQTIRPIPLWMAVVNTTPDSFSDDGVLNENAGENESEKNFAARIDKLIAHNVNIIDLGAESTRPHAPTVTAAEEWTRLEPYLKVTAERLSDMHIKPWLSVDSRRPAVLEKSLRYGVNIINDVTGLTDPNIIALAKQNDCQVIAMHSLTVPANPARTLPDDCDAVAHINQWAEEKMEAWAKAGMNLNNIILDPGIGFGKTVTQTYHLLAHVRELRRAGLRLLVGHSRKSFLQALTVTSPADHVTTSVADRDPESIGISLALAAQGADILRVHAPLAHMRAALAWAHVAAQP